MQPAIGDFLFIIWGLLNIQVGFKDEEGNL